MTFDNSFLKAKLMRDAGLGFFLCLAVFFAAFSFLMSQPAVAADAPPGYDAHDYQTIRGFLELSVDGVKNGEKINPEYSPDDPETWTGVTWDGVSSRRVKEIAWTEKGLAGIMNLSGCTALQKLTCDGNQLTGLVVNGCEALKGINCKNNYLTQLEFSDCPVLEILDCGFNPFTALTISGSQWREINLNNCEALQKLICTGIGNWGYQTGSSLIFLLLNGRF